MIKLKKRMSKYGSKSEYRATVSAGGSPSGLAANARSVGAPIFVFLAVVSVALRRVLVRGGEAAALVSRPFKVQFTSNWCSQKIPIFIGIFALYSITYFNLFADRLK